MEKNLISLLLPINDKNKFKGVTNPNLENKTLRLKAVTLVASVNIYPVPRTVSGT